MTKLIVLGTPLIGFGATNHPEGRAHQGSSLGAGARDQGKPGPKGHRKARGRDLEGPLLMETVSSLFFYDLSLLWVKRVSILWSQFLSLFINAYFSYYARRGFSRAQFVLVRAKGIVPCAVYPHLGGFSSGHSCFLIKLESIGPFLLGILYRCISVSRIVSFRK